MILLNSTVNRISAVKFEFSTEKYRSYWDKGAKIDCKSRWTDLVRQMVHAGLSEHSDWKGKKGNTQYISISSGNVYTPRISESCTYYCFLMVDASFSIDDFWFVSLFLSYFNFRYTVNELGRWEMEFGIHVKTYDQVTKKVGNITKPKWVPGGEIVIGPHVRMGRGKYGRVSQLLSCISQFSTLVDLIHFANQRIGNR